jgi:hypothetical protein
MTQQEPIMTQTRKYYAFFLPDFNHNSEPHWIELPEEVTTLATAQSYVGRFMSGLPTPEIFRTVDDGDKKVAARKDAAGKWKVALENPEADDSDQYTNDQFQYVLEGRLVSKEDFFKYGFKHEKVEKNRE